MKRVLVARPPSGIDRLSAEAQQSPLLQYLASLRSLRSRETMLCVLKRAAAELARLDGLDEDMRAKVTAESYQWGAPGALTYARVNLAVAAIAERHPPTARLALSALRGVARAAFNLGLLPIEERQRIDDVKGPRLKASLRGRRLTDEEITALYAACASDLRPQGRRDAAMFAVMLGAGLRRFEISALNVADCLPADESGAPAFRVRHGKGDKPDDVSAPPDVARAVEDWLRVRGRKRGALFLASPGRHRPMGPDSRLSPSGIYKALIARADQAGIAKTAPHDLRRSMITAFLERTGDLALAQRQARHSSPATTARYDKRAEAALKRVLATASTGYKPPA